jgi:carboxypeptidase PM20D1
VVVAPFLVIGATDGRHYQSVCNQIFRFLPLQIQSEDLSRIHGIDERVSEENYLRAIRFYVQLIKNSGKSE